MKIKTKLLISFFSVTAIILISGIFGIIETKSLYKESKTAALNNTPLAHAAMEIKLSVTTAYLWSENIYTSVSKKEKIQAVWQQLDEAAWYLNAMLKGGKNVQDTFYPVNNTIIIAEIRILSSNLEALKKIAQVRFYTHFETEQQDTKNLTEQFNILFHQFIQDVDHVEKMLHDQRKQHANLMAQKFTKSIIRLSLTTLLGFLIASIAVYYISHIITKQLGGEPTEIAYITEQVAAGNLNIQLKSETVTGIYAAIQIMVKKLKRIQYEKEQENWSKTGQALLNDLLSGEQDISKLTKNIISFLTTYVGAHVGLFYLLKEEQKPYLYIVATYAYTTFDDHPHKFFVGEGLVGQAALEQKIIAHNQTPEDCHPIIQSGLASRLPRYVLLLPFLYENTVKGIIEIGAAKQLTDIQQDFLKQVMLSIGIAINTAESRTRMQAQAEELVAQQEELRQNNDELEEQTKALQANETNLQSANRALETAGQEIETKAVELEMSNKYKSQFLANMSHELRSPLNSMLILSQDLAKNEDDNLTQDQVESAKIIYKGGNDLLTLINEILDLSKIEAGKMTVFIESVQLSEIASLLTSQFKPVSDQKDLNLECTLSDDLPATIKTDQQKLNQILKNLLSNAIKFTDQGGHVTVNFHKTMQGIGISVIDTGIGIPQDKQEEIFYAFQQVDGSLTRQYGGTGLGLSISKELAKLLGGNIQLSSVEQKGSTFTLNLPQETTVLSPILPPLSQDKRTIPKPITHDKETIFQDKKILLVDDDMRNMFALSGVLQKKGFNVFKAANGQDAMNILEKEPTMNIVIMDIMMPVMDGYETIRAIRAQSRFKHLAIIALTAKAMQDDHDDSITAGANDYLAKPVNIEQLLSLIRVWLYQ